MTAVTQSPYGRAFTWADLEAMPDDGHRYESSGCPSYWIVDPDIPSLLELRLRDGRYVETAHVKADEAFHADAPYAVGFTPAALIS